MTSPAALIFDMDDLLVRSAPIWKAAEETLLAAIGAEWTVELAARYKGMNSLDVARVIYEHYRPARSLAECQQLMRTALIDGFHDQVRAMPGAVSLVRRLAGRVPMAIASGSPLEVIEYCLKTLVIRAHFHVVISSESVSRGKPHPDVFLAAARALAVGPRECLVFEDSLIGARAARAAGMRCLAVPSSHAAEIAALATTTRPALTKVRVVDVFSIARQRRATRAYRGSPR